MIYEEFLDFGGKTTIIIIMKNVPEITIAWESAGIERHPLGRIDYHLYSTIEVNGLSMHVNAIEVMGENSLVAASKDLQNWVDDIADILDECPTSMLINGRHYQIVIVPYSCS